VDTCRILVVRRVGVDVSLGDAWSAITVTDRYHQMISEMADVELPKLNPTPDMSGDLITCLHRLVIEVE